MLDFAALSKARELWAAGATDNALKAFEVAVAQQPANVKALLEAARAFGGRFEIARAADLLDTAAAVAGQTPAVAEQIAVSYARIFRPAIAIAKLEAITNRSASARAELSVLYEQSGRLDEAFSEIEACIAAAPDAAEPRLAKARLQRRMGDGAAALEALPTLTHPALPVALRAEAWTELCFIHDRNGDHGAAAAAISEAHTLLRALPQTSGLLTRARSNNRLIQDLARDFTADMLATWQSEEGLSAQPLAHLVGFPRSGTTLLEQCLDAHPDLIASPERVTFTRDILPRLCHAGGGALTAHTLAQVPARTAIEERARYLTYMEAALGERVGPRLHLDKNPNHTGLLPGLLRLEPHARIVFALRDPRDVVTSCVLRTFRLTEFSAMLLDWGSAVELYAAEMSAWLRYREQIDPAQWVETRYEDMVADPMAETYRILRKLGLGWDDAVATYRDRLDGKFVNSPTQTEVRQPVHRHAIGRWHAYRQHLEPYMRTLEPFVKTLGYN